MWLLPLGSKCPTNLQQHVLHYGQGSDTGPPKVGAASLSFCWFRWLCLVIFLGLPVGFPTFPAFSLETVFLWRLFVDRNLLAWVPRRLSERSL